jgi:hypothetical protein
VISVIRAVAAAASITAAAADAVVFVRRASFVDQVKVVLDGESEVAKKEHAAAPAIAKRIGEHNRVLNTGHFLPTLLLLTGVVVVVIIVIIVYIVFKTASRLVIWKLVQGRKGHHN